MGPSISEVLPFAVGVAISPIPLVAVILMLFTPRAKANGTAFLVGWAVGLAVLATVGYVIADTAGASSDATASDTTSTFKIVLGVLLLLGAFHKWSSRPAPGETPSMPKWMAGIDRFTPARAGGLGVLLGAVNPKNLALTLGAAAALAQLGSGGRDAAAGLVAFVVVASSTTAIAVGYRVLGGDRSRERLDSAKAWLTTHDDAVMAVLFLVFGVVLLAQGTGRLTA